MGEVLSVQNLTKRYGTKTALDGLSVALEQGRFYGLIGPEGAGKTTLLRLLAGLCFPPAGSLASVSSIRRPFVASLRAALFPPAAAALLSLPGRAGRRAFCALPGHSRQELPTGAAELSIS